LASRPNYLNTNNLIMRKKFLFLLLACVFTGLCFTSCEEEDIEGCMDTQSNNFNAEATIDDGSCTYDRDQFIGDWLGSIIFEGNLETISSDSIAFTIDTGIDPTDKSSVNVTFTSTAVAGISSTATVDGNAISFSTSLVDFPIDLPGLGTLNADISVEGNMTITGNELAGTMDAAATPTGTTVTVADTGVLTATKQ